MHEAAVSLMALADLGRNGYVEVPPPGVTPEVYEELIKCGHAVSRSDHLWMDGWRVYSPRAVRAGLYRPYVQRSIYTRIASPGVRIPYVVEIENMDEGETSAEDFSGLCEKSRMD